MKAIEKMISIYPGYSEKENNDKMVFIDAISDLTGKRIIPFSCARAAMVFGLRALGIGRMDEILVPPWLGQCVLSALSRAAFPTMTPSRRTKAIFVFHQFGYPQRLEEIDKVASENGWIILNDCANTIFSEYRGGRVTDWGDFSVFSFSKLYPCTLGGALASSRSDIIEAIDASYQILSRKHACHSNVAHGILENTKRGLLGPEREMEIAAVYGYLPELVAFPSNALQWLPNTHEEIKNDVEHRKSILSIITSYFPDRVPDCDGSDVVPFAVPIAGPPEELESLSREIKETIDVEVPILHFDFQRNMLNPDYQKSLVIGCHEGWGEELVRRTCDLIKVKTKTASHTK